MNSQIASVYVYSRDEWRVLKERTDSSKFKESEEGGLLQKPASARDLSAEILDMLTKYGGRPPHFIARAIGVDERLVVSTLKALERQGKIKLRTPNVEWKWKAGRK